MKIGHYTLNSQLILAPMAGITDRPFRNLCRHYGAGLAVSEMVASQPHLQNHHRTLLKSNHSGETEPRAVQILGTDPQQMAKAAQGNVERGAQIIDINMGCPAKKVCAVAAGSALLKNEPLVREILEAVVNAVDVPVTLKIRTGWDENNRNAITIAKIAEQAGIQALTIHGRTRRCGFRGQAEYQTIKQVKQAVNLPIIANGDIDSPEKARQVLEETGADAIMIGRASQGRPWLFAEINHYLQQGQHLKPPTLPQIQTLVQQHLESLYDFYGEKSGVRIARKHIAWYFEQCGGIERSLRQQIFQVNHANEQLISVNAAFSTLAYS